MDSMYWKDLGNSSDNPWGKSVNIRSWRIEPTYKKLGENTIISLSLEIQVL